MEVRWRGDLCFELKESTGTTVLMEPHTAVGGTEQTIQADIVTISEKQHINSIKHKLSNEAVLLENLNVFEHKGVTVNGTKPAGGDHPAIFKVHMDGVDICHLGRINQKCDIDLVSDLLPVDVLIVPVGGEDSLDADDALDYIDALMPDLVIPTHYKTKDSGSDLDKLSVFLKHFEEDQIITFEEDFYEISRDDMTHETTLVLVPEKHLL